MRKCRSTAFLGFLACFVILFVVAQPSGATIIDTLTWEQLLLGADCVALVECTTAGGIVAKYKVLESFKGPVVGTEISLRIAVDYWGPQFPIALVGEQFFVTAYKSPPSTWLFTSGGSVPLWWRKIPADYSLPLSQGTVPMAFKDVVMKATGLMNAEGGAFVAIGFDGKVCKDFDEFRQAVRTLTAAAPPRQELALDRSRTLMALIWGPGSRRDGKKTEAMVKIAAAPDLPQMIDAATQLARSDPEACGALPAIVARYGKENTLKCLEALPRDAWPEGPQAYDKVIEEKRAALKAEAAGKPSEEEQKESESTAVPDEKKLATLRKDLEIGILSKPLVVQCKYDPAAVAKYLAAWKNPQKSRRDADAGYWEGSLFAHLCGKDRAKHLRTLLDAQDP